MGLLSGLLGGGGGGGSATTGGFFGSGGKTSATNTTNETRNQEAGFSDVSGQALSVQGDNNTVELSDFGAIGAAANLADNSLTLADRSGERVLDFADVSNERNARLALDALEFGDRASERSLVFGSDLFAESGSLVRSIFNDAFEQSADVLREGQTQLGNTVTNLNAIARQQSTSDSERVQSIAEKALIGAAIVAAVLIFASMKGRA